MESVAMLVAALVALAFVMYWIFSGTARRAEMLDGELVGEAARREATQRAEDA